MKNKGLLFIAGVALMPALALGFSWNRGDSATKSIELKAGKPIVYTVDLNKESAIKSLFQPNYYSLRFRFRVEGKPELYCKPEPGNLEFYVSQGQKKGIWPKLDEAKPLEKNKPSLRAPEGSGGRAKREHIPVSVEIKVPEKTAKGELEGRLLFFEKDKEYSRVIIKVINAK